MEPCCKPDLPWGFFNPLGIFFPCDDQFETLMIKGRPCNTPVIHCETDTCRFPTSFPCKVTNCAPLKFVLTSTSVCITAKFESFGPVHTGLSWWAIIACSTSMIASAACLGVSLTRTTVRDSKGTIIYFFRSIVSRFYYLVIPSIIFIARV